MEWGLGRGTRHSNLRLGMSRWATAFRGNGMRVTRLYCDVSFFLFYYCLLNVFVPLFLLGVCIMPLLYLRWLVEIIPYVERGAGPQLACIVFAPEGAHCDATPTRRDDV